MATKTETSFSKIRLENGLTLLTEKIPNVRSVSFGFWVNVGARDESEDISGMSHYLEHLLFKGTKKYTARQISEIFDTLGAELNAFSAKEYTCFYSRLLDEHLPAGLEVIASLLQEPLMGQAEIASEKEVVLEEISLYEDTPDEKIHDLVTSALWSDHPLGRNILGSLETVKNFSLKEIKTFFSRNYFPKNILLAVAGSFDQSQLVELVEKHFQAKDKNQPVRQETKPKVKPKVMVHKKKTEQAHICLGAEAIRARDKNRFALAALDLILGGGMSSRLYQEVREKRGLVYSIYSYHSLYTETGLIAVYAGTRPANAEKVIKLIKSEIVSIINKGITDEELHRAKEHLKGQLILGLESTANRMMRLGKSELTHGEILTMNELIERIEMIKQKEVKDLACRIFQPEKMVLTIIGGFKEDRFHHILS